MIQWLQSYKQPLPLIQLYILIDTIVLGILLTLLDHVMLENTVSCPLGEYHQPELNM